MPTMPTDTQDKMPTTPTPDTLRPSTTTYPSCGGRLVTTDGKDLPLRRAGVSADARGGIARVVFRQTFANPHNETLRVIYTMPLPADGAVAGYEFRIGERRVNGKIEKREKAREQFEQALVEGRAAGLLDQERVNLFTQEIGNVPPGEEVAVELTIDQRLSWLAEGMWEWRFPLVAAPRYLGAEGRVRDAGNVTVDVAERPTGVRASLDLTIRDSLIEGRAPESASHPLALAARTERERGATRVTFSEEGGAPLDRDIVVRWAIPRPGTGLSIQTARPGADSPIGSHAYGLLTIVPPAVPEGTLPRDLVVLLDTSGSMTGQPLEHAKRVVAALIDSLRDENEKEGDEDREADRLEMIAFSMKPRRWQQHPVAATADHRRKAHRWLAGLRAGGCTEMLDAVLEALRPLRADAQRQVILVTDGQIGFESELVAELRDRLPAGSRLHTVGVGEAVNRALLGPAARAGRGQEVIIGLGEDPERGVSRILAATQLPVVTELELGGSALEGHAPRRLPDLLGGKPVLAAVRLKTEGGALTVRGRTPGGPWQERITVQSIEPGHGPTSVIALYGRETVEDLEVDLAVGENRREIDTTIERLGLEFGIATRLTSWVAISEEPTVDPRRPVKYERMPQELPYGMSAEGLGLRGAVASARILMGPASADLSMLATTGLELCDVGFDRMEQEGPRAAAPDEARPAARKRWRIFGTPKKEEEKELPAPPPAPDEGAPDRYIGRWVGVLRDSIQVLVFEVTGHGLRWDPATVATVVLRNGTQKEVTVDDAASSLSGPVAPGRLLRLGLALDRKIRDKVIAVIIMTGQTRIRIEM
jgi:Ca-activated chloride channel family protein